MHKFIFAEHKPKIDPHKTTDKKQLVYFRACIPTQAETQPYIDVFCPFVSCLKYRNNVYL